MDAQNNQWIWLCDTSNDFDMEEVRDSGRVSFSESGLYELMGMIYDIL